MMKTSKKIAYTLIVCAAAVIGFISSPAHAQIASASLDHSRSLFFNQDIINPTLESKNSIFPQSSYVLSPQTSGWRKFRSISISYDTRSSKPELTSTSGATSKTSNQGSHTNNSVNFGSSYFINKIYYLDINAKSTDLKYMQSDESFSPTVERNSTGMNINFGARIGQVFSLGVGVSQVNSDSTYNSKDPSGDSKTTLNSVEQTLAVGFSFRFGNFFIGAGSDIDTGEKGNIKTDDNKQEDMKSNYYSKYYAGVGLSMGHPRDSEVHIELTYLSIPGSEAQKDFKSLSFIRTEYTEYALNAEVIYFDFYFGIFYKTGSFTDTKSDSGTFGNHTYVNQEIGMGYIGDKGFYFTLRGGTVSTKAKMKYNDASLVEIEDKGSSASAGIGLTF